MPSTAQSEGRAALVELQRCLVDRRIEDGTRLLDRLLAEQTSGRSPAELGIPFLLSLAQWIDLGYGGSVPLEEWAAGALAGDRSLMGTGEFLQLRLLEAFLCLRRQDFARAAFLLRSTLETGTDVLRPYHAFVAQFWLGRTERLAGDFDQSLRSFRRASELAETMGAPRLVAVTRIHQSWLVFFRGERAEALRLLDLAEDELRPTRHALSLANISAARGRFVRSSGQYAEALRHFLRAIEIYLPDHGDHPNLARAYVNAAYVKRLMALELQPAPGTGGRVGAEPASARTHRLRQGIAAEALDLLEKAASIYSRHRHQGGTGAVLVNTGYLHLESGNIVEAAATAAEAFELGEQRGDLVLMARARILQGSVELAFCEEQLDEQPEEGTHAVLAARYADAAVALAGQTQNRRLLAAASIVRGLIATEELNLDWALARACAAKASALLDEHDRDHLFRELRALNRRITRSAAIDETMRAWCDGELGGKTFQQVEEQFAEIVIPRVWARLDRKVSRVARELSISPKKVRRILRAARQLRKD